MLAPDTVALAVELPGLGNAQLGETAEEAPTNKPVVREVRLEEEGPPGERARKPLAAVGSQKFASLMCGRSRRYVTQALSVTPTTALMVGR